MSKKNFFTFILFSAFTLLALNDSARAQETGDAPRTRSINSLDFQAQRPAVAPKKSISSGNNPESVKSPVKNQKRRKNIAVLTNPKRNYKWIKRNTVAPKKKTVPPRGKKARAEVVEEESLGVTFWRLRPLKSEEREDAPTFPVNTGDGTEFWTAERVRSTTRFKVDDRVRFTIESPRSGYIYVVNREVYIDNTRGEAKLIYPTLRTRNRGDNSVTAGTTVDLPSGQGVFRIASKRDDYAGEEVIVIVSPTKLPAIKIGADAISITDERLDKWIADWGATTDTFDATDGEGIAMTRTENEASAVSRALLQEEPSPQTIFKTLTRTNQPMLVSFQMLSKTPN